MIPYCLALASMPLAQPQPSVQPNHPRLALAMNIKEGGGPEEFMEEVRFQVRLGLNGSVVSFKWSDIEPPQGEKDLKKITDYVGLISLMGAESAVTIQTLDTNNRTTPSDLTFAWDDPRTLARWDAFLTSVVPLFGPRVKHLSLGNEVDAWLKLNPGDLPAYKVFLARGRETVHRIRPDLKVGVTVMASSYLSTPQWTKDLVQGMDVHFTTYYAMEDSFKVKQPTEIQKDLSSLVSFDPSRPIIVQEIGMAASPLMGSSEARQADFVRQMMKFFTSKGGRVPLVAWFISTDFSPAFVQALQAYYGSSDERFTAYLSTLGLKNSKGEPRPAHRAFIEESKKWISGL